MGDEKSAKRAGLAAEITKRIVIALCVRALWAAIREGFFPHS